MLQTVNNTYIAQPRRLFHCTIKIKIPANYDESVLERGFALLEDIDDSYNSYKEGSVFSRINANAGDWVAVDDNTAIMLQSVSKVSELTHGAYDVTIMPLLRLWGFYKADFLALPTQKQLQDAIQHVDYTQIQQQGLRAKIASGQEIITGSFIKAFAVDILVKQLKAEGVTHGVVNAGGSTIYAINKDCVVNLPHPFIKDAKCGSIKVNNACFSMSAAMSGAITINGEKYGHIINAKTGYPSRNIQSGVICKSAFLSDVLSTAIFSIDEENLEAVIASLKAHFDFEANVITQGGNVITTGYIPFKEIQL